MHHVASDRLMAEQRLTKADATEWAEPWIGKLARQGADELRVEPDRPHLAIREDAGHDVIAVYVGALRGVEVLGPLPGDEDRLAARVGEVDAVGVHVEALFVRSDPRELLRHSASYRAGIEGFGIRRAQVLGGVGQLITHG
jgi:hypothetical protein